MPTPVGCCALRRNPRWGTNRGLNLVIYLFLIGMRRLARYEFGVNLVIAFGGLRGVLGGLHHPSIAHQGGIAHLVIAPTKHDEVK